MYIFKIIPRIVSIVVNDLAKYKCGLSVKIIQDRARFFINVCILVKYVAHSITLQQELRIL